MLYLIDVLVPYMDQTTDQGGWWPRRRYEWLEFITPRIIVGFVASRPGFELTFRRILQESKKHVFQKH